MRYWILLFALILAGCTSAPGVPTEVKTITLKVPVRASCPDTATYQGLKRTKPTPLRNSPMPASTEERTAKTAAQLGRYEADGGWADRVSAALDRCQIEEPVARQP